jgi:peptidyl-prolyl cis-trans isomerase SurA
MNFKITISALAILLSTGMVPAAPKKESCLPVVTTPKKTQIDTIKVMIFGPEGTDIITKSDIERPGLDGKPRSLDDIIMERAMYQKAGTLHMHPDQEAIDKQLANVMRENKLTPEQMDQIFISSGYTPEEGRRQFGIMIAVNSLISFKITSRLIVPDKDVLAYYQANPEVVEAEYQLQRTVVPFSAVQDKQAQKKRIEALARSGKLSAEVTWSPAFWIADSELADDLRPLVQHNAGHIGQPRETSDGFEVYQLVNKKSEQLRSLQERYRDIVNILRQPKLEEMMEDFKKELLAEVTIVYVD